jgi:hypothetical protein
MAASRGYLDDPQYHLATANGKPGFNAEGLVFIVHFGGINRRILRWWIQIQVIHCAWITRIGSPESNRNAELLLHRIVGKVYSRMDGTVGSPI